jgi:predicted transcriptional regulator
MSERSLSELQVKILAMLNSCPRRPWTAPELIEAGIGAKSSCVGVALKGLHTRGLVSRTAVRRGAARYEINRLGELSIIWAAE